MSEGLTETEAGKPFMSSADAFTLNHGNDTYRVYTGNFRQSLETNSNAVVSVQRDEDDADEEN